MREFQSTPPVVEGRRTVRWLSTLTCTSFNPRPPLSRGEGRPCVHGDTDQLEPVSIHAPRCRGAKDKEPNMTDTTLKFQSTPPVVEGRRRARSPHAGDISCFNPRPPLSRGEGRRTTASCRPYRFQSTPPVVEGRRAMLPAWNSKGEVSIHAPRCRGAKASRVTSTGDLPTFQSTPPVVEGRRA